MEITRRSDYACRILRAAYHANGDYVSIHDISEEEGIPYAFARNIEHALLQTGIIKTRRGAHGGLALNVDPTAVTLYDLMKVLGANVSVAPCSEDPESCDKSPGCTFNRVWITADKLLEGYFSSLTLEDILTGDLDGEFTLQPCRCALTAVCEDGDLSGRACETAAAGHACAKAAAGDKVAETAEAAETVEAVEAAGAVGAAGAVEGSES